MTRTVVISGGGSGIGLATARCFAAEGDQVVLAGRRGEVLEQAAAQVPGALAVPADLATAEGARRLARTVAEEFGAVDVLVHSAGGNGRLESEPEGLDREDPVASAEHDWTLNFRLNTLTAVLLTEALRERLASPGGRVLFLSSIAAYRGSGSGAYAASKAALHPYAFDLARTLGPRGVTVNVVAPGYVESTEFFGEGLPRERHERLVDETFNGRPGTPGDVAETLHWLASHSAGHITGQVIQVNGGAYLGR
ncbi:SDR family NAD(P)-dependent oxidoreductase [Streptomyces sp. WMMC897]|uniref:SDR family NAD(P)-dependent oxidoreductase n=1 Tax=Streptomyces sp. WMMC897 TaxID=3014782 RepID=UPI0022B73AFA|nr:SDR family oxidoreductase [Streptomyces sp. WMMC897]MCZ7417605.1 SDR family NAD(P)-dependent oxidoreductase [Streptomyces sp. WMMC897]